MKYLILAEKPSAAKHLAEALGGFSGFINFIPNSTDANSYDIVAAHGHLLELKEPHEMVTPEKVIKYKDWVNLDSFPWNPEDFTWEKRPKKGAQDTLNKIKRAAHGHDAIIIATDDDPSGEGDVLGQEIIDYIGWNKLVLRARFADESPKSLKQALSTLTDVTNKATYGKYQKGIARERFDFLSMQLSRIALIAERTADYNVKTQKLGRLKSVIIGLINYQIQARKNYVKKPFYEIRFKDENNHVFKEKDAKHYDKQDLANENANGLHSSSIKVIGQTLKKQEPPQMLNLSHLSVLVGKHGFKSKQVLDIYQKMYQHNLVSYPRTADRKITQQDFDQLLPLAPKIAKAINLDTKLLTQTTCRTKFLTEKADHGANRPGTNVPSSLAAVEEEYGLCGRMIYETLARSFLAILGSDYTYKQIEACLVSYPSFTSTIKIPQEHGFKDIFNSEKDLKEKDETLTITNFGATANPIVFEGQNTKPKEPGHLFVINYLSKHNIGTGATQESTLAEISTGTDKLIENKKEKYSLTDLGLIQATISMHTQIASPKVTFKLQEAMEQVEKLAIPTMAVPNTMTNIVNHDKQTILNNQPSLTKIPELQKAKNEWNKRQEKMKVPKVNGNWKGKEVQIKTKWGDHTFTETELAQLFAEKTIKISSYGKEIAGKLMEQTFKGHTFVGFCANKEENDDYITGIFEPTNKEVTFKKTFGNHIYTDQEAHQLLAGNTIKFSATSKSGKPYEVSGQLKAYRYKGKRCFGFKAEFDK